MNQLNKGFFMNIADLADHEMQTKCRYRKKKVIIKTN